MKTTSGFALALSLGLGLGLVGCAPEMGTVQGKVTVDGKPVQGIEVTFEPVGKEGGTAIGYTNAEGHYALQFPGRQAGAPPGEYLVKLAGGEVADSDVAPVQIPDRYNSKSDLKRTVEPGDNTLDFTVESK